MIRRLLLPIQTTSPNLVSFECEKSEFESHIVAKVHDQILDNLSKLVVSAKKIAS